MTLGPIAPLGGGIGVAPSSASGSAANGPAGAPAAPVPTAGSAVPSALGALIGEAIAAQDGLAPLLADLAAALASPNLPPAARATAQAILALQSPLNETVTGPGLQAAVAATGLFLEAMLAEALVTPGAALPGPADDLKSLLARLPGDFGTDPQLAGLQAAPPPPRPVLSGPRRSGRPAPPARGAPTSGQPPEDSVLTPETDEKSLAHALTHDAQAALARLQLSQLASTPKPGEPQRWRFELPVETSEGPAIAQFEISHDGRQAGAAPEVEPTWRARFSLNVEHAGPVHAEVALSGPRTRVTLWAEGQSLLTQLEAAKAALTEDLVGPEGADAAVRVLAGAPAPPPAQAGRLLDRTS